jgi:DNA ligase 1
MLRIYGREIMIEEREILYKLSKTGNVLRFEVIARSIEGGAVLITRKGYINGATQEDIEPMYPKNVGRANETTPYQQALVMFNSKVNKLKDKGYKDVLLGEGITYKELVRLLYTVDGTDAQGNFLPMLAQKDTNKIKFPGLIQPKLDGMRCFAEHTDEGIVLRTRRGKVLTHLKHIEKAIAKALPKGWSLDGELYHHERSLQQIISMVKRAQPDNDKIEFRAYDMVPGRFDTPFKDRLLLVYGLVNKMQGPIDEVDTYEVNNMEEVMALFHRFRDKGFEGAMWRDPESSYEPGKRSWGLIKIKDFDEDEFEITDVLEATGRDSGTAIFECKTPRGKRFTVRPMGSRAMRRQYLEDSETLIGEMLTVRFQGYSDEGVPLHLRGICIRNYE